MSDSAPPPLVVTLTGHQPLLVAACGLLADCHHDLSLLTQALDPRVFGDASFVEAAKQFLLVRRNARLRVLVAQPQQAMRGRHPLVELGRLLASRVEFREFAPGRPAPMEEMLLADGRLLLERNSADALEARLIRDDPATARERQRRFNLLWDHALPSMELRRLGI